MRSLTALLTVAALAAGLAVGVTPAALAVGATAAALAVGATPVAEGPGSRVAPAAPVLADLRLPGTGTVRALCPGSGGGAHCQATVVTDPTGRVAGTPAPTGYLPADLQNAYRLTAAAATRGSHQTIGIVAGADDPTAERDMQHYRATFGLPGCSSVSGCFRKVDEFGAAVTSNLLGDAGGLSQGSVEVGGETSLDLDMASALCPRCHIVLVEALTQETQDLALAANTAAHLGATVVSTSYASPEDSTAPIVDMLYDTPGTVQVAASGDGGYEVNYPASSPNVVAVGGTTLRRDARTLRGWTETAWNRAGSGCSTMEAKPAWQHDSLCPMRSVADVAAMASPGVAVYDTYGQSSTRGWLAVGGTSAASPMIAAVFGLAGNTGGMVGAGYIYAHHKALFDVVGGSNNPGCADYTCEAVPGYDGPTGWGTPNGVAGF